MLSHPHGGNHPRIMSSFYFDDASQGPPQDSDGNIVSRGVDENGLCTNGWVCEHRWAPIANMIKFRAVTDGTTVRAFTNIAQNQISFCRGNKGLVVLNNADRALDATVNACVPDGYYCDVVSGEVVNGKCSGKTVYVKQGKAHVELETNSAGVLAIHVAAKPTICACEQNAEVGRRNRQVDETDSEELESDEDSVSDEESSESSPESEDSKDSVESSPDEEEDEDAESPEEPASAKPAYHGHHERSGEHGILEVPREPSVPGNPRFPGRPGRPARPERPDADAEKPEPAEPDENGGEP